MEPKRYEITTLADLAGAYRETDNKDGLMQDLRAYLDIGAFARAISDAVGEKAPEVGPLNWIDDGRNDATINLSVKEKGEA